MALAAIAARDLEKCQEVLSRAVELRLQNYPRDFPLPHYRWVGQLVDRLEQEAAAVQRLRTALTRDPCDHEEELAAALDAGEALALPNPSRDPVFCNVKRNAKCASVEEGVEVMQAARELQASIAPRRECVNVFEEGMAARDEALLQKAFAVSVFGVGLFPDGSRVVWGGADCGVGKLLCVDVSTLLGEKWCWLHFTPLLRPFDRLPIRVG